LNVIAIIVYGLICLEGVAFADLDVSLELKPSLKYKNLRSFEDAIGKPGCLLKSEKIWFFAPKEYESSSKVILPYLTAAYEELFEITGTDTEYIIVVYNFPEGHKDAFGGTSNCVLWYDDSNLRLENFEEWTKYKVPHVSGYIEEMAHNFVHARKVQFGWEMVGWSISIQASKKVAANPAFLRQLKNTRKTQLITFKKYLKNKLTFPSDVPANKVDRIHAFILGQCEKKYGNNFWRDFFANVEKRSKSLKEAVKLKGGKAIRNRRYQISIECFEELKGIDFKRKLSKYGISLTASIKSLEPESKKWNRKLK
jgi:hypothetical protein